MPIQEGTLVHAHLNQGHMLCLPFSNFLQLMTKHEIRDGHHANLGHGYMVHPPVQTFL